MTKGKSKKTQNSEGEGRTYAAGEGNHLKNNHSLDDLAKAAGKLLNGKSTYPPQKKRGDSENSPRKVLASQRERTALKLRTSGATYAQIGETLGISEMGAWKAVNRAYKRVQSEVLETAQELIVRQLLRCDEMMLGLWPSARKGELGAVDRALKVMQRESQLMGLDRPIQIQYSFAQFLMDQGWPESDISAAYNAMVGYFIEMQKAKSAAGQDNG